LPRELLKVRHPLATFAAEVTYALDLIGKMLNFSSFRVNKSL
jgi:hypothetical protein